MLSNIALRIIVSVSVALVLAVIFGVIRGLDVSW